MTEGLITTEDRVTNTLADIALSEDAVGSYFITDEQITWLSWEGIAELGEKVNHKAVDKKLEVDISATSTGILISWHPIKNARNS